MIDHDNVLLGSCLHILDGHVGLIRCLILKGDIIVSGGDQKRIIIWDVKVLFYAQKQFIVIAIIVIQNQLKVQGNLGN